MSSILPKGIVINTPEISADIQKIDREPLALEEIAKFWKVYTTTNRRLVDPTAERLENFWWRIWGSPKRNLKGAVVARIFADISDEISFVPLRGPLNRDESGGRSMISLTRGLRTASSTTIHGRQGSNASCGLDSSSLSKYASTMPPPILKKSRGPSSIGPRPTARFISPQTSEEEEEEAAEVSSSASLDTKVLVRPPTLPNPMLREGKKAEGSAGSRKKGHGLGATVAPHRRRPRASRRSISDPATKGKESPSSSNNDVCDSLLEKTDQQCRPKDFSSQPGLNEHRPASSVTFLSVKPSKKTQPEKSSHTRGRHNQDAVQRSHKSVTKQAVDIVNVNVGESDQPQPIETKEGCQPKGCSADKASQLKSEEKLTTPWQAKSQPAVSSQPLALTDLVGSTLQSDRLAQARITRRHLRNSVDGIESSSVLQTHTPTTTEAVQRDKPDIETAVNFGVKVSKGGDKGPAGGLEQASLFAKRAIQPAKSSSALFSTPVYQSNGSMSRSKSQLTLLLERDQQK